jgi:CubicO group peptidase (beta-lactamase class C family)
MTMGRPAVITRHAAMLGACLLAAAPAVRADPPPPAKPPGVTELAGYTPIEVAPGAPGTHPLAEAPAGDATVSPAALAKAQAYSDSFGGHALLVWQGGKIRYEHYGEGVGADTRFETFSMHKSILGLVYGAALRDGVIGSLDETAGEHLPEWRDDPRGKITLRQLLTMESGLSLGHADNKAEVALAQPLDAPPGSRFEYNNANSEIAGVILDRALRKAGRGDYAAYLSHVLLQPLGAGDAHLWLDHEGGEPRFYAFCQMRARDWLRVGVLIDRRGRFDGAQVLPAAWIQAMTTPSALNPNYGLQMWIGSPWSRWRAYGPRTPMKISHDAPYLASDLVFFDGFGGERVYMVPSLDLVIVRIGESSLQFDDSVVPNAIIAGLRGAPASR